MGETITKKTRVVQTQSILKYTSAVLVALVAYVILRPVPENPMDIQRREQQLADWSYKAKLMLDASKMLHQKASEMQKVTVTSHQVLRVFEAFKPDEKPYIPNVVAAYQILALVGLEPAQIKKEMTRLAREDAPMIGKFIESSDYHNPHFWEALKGIEKFAPPEAEEAANKILENMSKTE